MSTETTARENGVSTEVQLDLHGYTTHDALYDLVPRFIEWAWLRGCAAVTLIHGSPDISSPSDARILARGGTKWGLRTALNRGDFRRWVWYPRSKRHRKEPGALTLALRPNPRPQSGLPRPAFPEPMFRYEGPWHRH
jgi:hypothetical protein